MATELLSGRVPDWTASRRRSRGGQNVETSVTVLSRAAQAPLFTGTHPSTTRLEFVTT